MSKTPRLRASSSLRGGRLKGKGKEVLGARETPGAQEEGGKSEVGSRKSEKDTLRAEVSLLHDFQRLRSCSRRCHIFHTVTIDEIKTGNARFHALAQFDLHSFDQNFLSFENSLF